VHQINGNNYNKTIEKLYTFLAETARMLNHRGVPLGWYPFPDS
jgi:hypothetical protein